MRDDDFDPYHKWLSIPKTQRPPTFYQLLGIPHDERDHESIQGAAKQREDYVRKFLTGSYKSHAESLLFQLQEARVTLLNRQSRERYDSKLGLLHKRQNKNALAAGYSLEGGGAVSVGEESDLAIQFAKIMAVILAGFVIMAVVSYRLNWLHLRDEQPAEAVATPKPVPKIATVAPPKIGSNVPPKVAVAPVVPPVAPPINPPLDAAVTDASRDTIQFTGRVVSVARKGTQAIIDVDRDDGGSRLSFLVQPATNFHSEIKGDSRFFREGCWVMTTARRKGNDLYVDNLDVYVRTQLSPQFMKRPTTNDYAVCGTVVATDPFSVTLEMKPLGLRRLILGDKAQDRIKVFIPNADHVEGGETVALEGVMRGKIFTPSKVTAKLSKPLSVEQAFSNKIN